MFYKALINKKNIILIVKFNFKSEICLEYLGIFQLKIL